MQWIAIILPSFFSVKLVESLEQKEMTWLQFVKNVGIFIMLTNLISTLIFYYVCNISISFSKTFDDVIFADEYLAVNLAAGFVLPIIYVILKPYISVGVEPKSTTSKRKKGKKVEDEKDN